MTVLLTILGMWVLVWVAGWLLALLEPPPPRPERLVNRLWASGSLWRESKPKAPRGPF